MIDIWVTIKHFINTKIKKSTRYIAILGHPGSGKTTLWNALRKPIDPNRREYISTIGVIKIEKFKITPKGKKPLTIVKPRDIGGTTDALESYFKDLVKSYTKIFYLVDVTKIKNNKKIIDEQLQYIKKEIDKNPYLKDVSINILLTHVDECKEEHEKGAKEFREKYNNLTMTSINLFGDSESLERLKLYIYNCRK